MPDYELLVEWEHLRACQELTGFKAVLMCSADYVLKRCQSLGFHDCHVSNTDGQFEVVLRHWPDEYWPYDNLEPPPPQYARVYIEPTGPVSCMFSGCFLREVADEMFPVYRDFVRKTIELFSIDKTVPKWCEPTVKYAEKRGAPRVEDRPDWPEKCRKVENIEVRISKGELVDCACKTEGLSMATFHRLKKRICSNKS